MTIRPSRVCSTTTRYKVASGLEIGICIDQNPYALQPASLFQLALRNNPKRRFLFVSKVLGKHLPVDPRIPGLAGFALALCYAEKAFGQNHQVLIERVLGALCRNEDKMELSKYALEGPLELPESTLFVGFAETATALGYSAFTAFTGKGRYIHTTREQLVDTEVVTRFEEEHSHATAHRIYTKSGENPLKGSDTLVLVDDEITTGKTALNIIEAIQKQFPRKRYALLSLLDWRSPKDREAFKALEHRLGIEIVTVSLISGQIEVADSGYDADFYALCEEQNRQGILNANLQTATEEHGVDVACDIRTVVLDPWFDETVEFTSVEGDGRICSVPYIADTGRFGIDNTWPKKTSEKAQAIAEHLLSDREVSFGKRWLCLGTGEFIQIPAMIASALASKNPQMDVLFHATTRSPICPLDEQDYGARNAYHFKNPEDMTLVNHIYNIEPGAYDALFIFMERARSREACSELIEAIKTMGIPNVRFVFCRS